MGNGWGLAVLVERQGNLPALTGRTDVESKGLTLPSSIRWIFEMTPKLPLPMLLTRRYLSISLGSAKDADVGDAEERRAEAMV